MSNGFNHGPKSALIQDFVRRVVAAVDASVVQRLQTAIAGAFGAPQKRGPGRPAKQPVVATRSAGKKTRPKQLCPVPGCKNVAAPIFGMVCKDHKNVAKSKIAKYRAERKGTPVSAGKPAAAKRAKKTTPKVARARKLQG